MKTLIFDIETNGLLTELDTVHCITIFDTATGEHTGYADQPGFLPLKSALALLELADCLIGHNILTFDLPALKKVYGWAPRPGTIVRDTLVLSRLIWPHVKTNDFTLAKKGRLPANMIGVHSLAAWGHRLGEHKGDYKGGWDQWSPAMHEYMMQDAVVTAKLWSAETKALAEWGVPWDTDTPVPGKDCVVLEHRMAAICDAIQRHGFRFDTAKAVELVEKLQLRRRELETQLQAAFPPLTHVTTFVPKVNNKPRGYVKGVPVQKEHVVEFNPGSRQMVGQRLIALGWNPREFGKDGHPTVDDDILNSLPYPEAKLLAEYFTVQKRLGQIAEGKEAWFRHSKNSRIHGRIISNGAHTGRATHSGPNMGQVPKVGVVYGDECRECFTADYGDVLVGADADALELRDLAGFMARWDGGDYINTVLNGRKEDKTDMHSRNAMAIGCSREVAKVFFYALIYGARDLKLGEILGFEGRRAMAKGRAARAALMSGVPALGALVKAVQAVSKSRGWLRGLDGRRLEARSENAALNTLLQSAGAVQCKRWIVTFIDNATAAGLVWGRDYAIVAWVHDEVQLTVRPERVALIKQMLVEAIAGAGKYYGFACQLAGNADEGRTWRDTH